MTTLGHSLTGLAALTLCMPKRLTNRQQFFWVICFISLASLPDWPLPGWGHRQLLVSHSLWVNLIICTLVVATLRIMSPLSFGNIRILICGGAAWMSHLGMDTLYGDLPGVIIHWPFSDNLVSLPLPWLKSLPQVPPPFDIKVLKILLFEFLTFSPLVLIAYVLRYIWAPENGQD